MSYTFDIWFPFFNIYFWFALFYALIVIGLLFTRLTWKEYWIYFFVFTFLFATTNYFFFYNSPYPVLSRYNQLF